MISISANDAASRTNRLASLEGADPDLKYSAGRIMPASPPRCQPKNSQLHTALTASRTRSRMSADLAARKPQLFAICCNLASEAGLTH